MRSASVVVTCIEVAPELVPARHSFTCRFAGSQATMKRASPFASPKMARVAVPLLTYCQSPAVRGASIQLAGGWAAGGGVGVGVGTGAGGGAETGSGAGGTQEARPSPVAATAEPMSSHVRRIALRAMLLRWVSGRAGTSSLGVMRALCEGLALYSSPLTPNRFSFSPVR